MGKYSELGLASFILSIISGLGMILGSFIVEFAGGSGYSFFTNITLWWVFIFLAAISIALGAASFVKNKKELIGLIGAGLAIGSLGFNIAGLLISMFI